jgi:hypothetical protein
MERPNFEIPEDWKDSLAELKASVAASPYIEDEEDRMIREGQAMYDALSPEEKTEWDQSIKEMLEAFQRPGVMEAVDKAFRRGSIKTE